MTAHRVVAIRWEEYSRLQRLIGYAKSVPLAYDITHEDAPPFKRHTPCEIPMAWRQGLLDLALECEKDETNGQGH